MARGAVFTRYHQVPHPGEVQELARAPHVVLGVVLPDPPVEPRADAIETLAVRGAAVDGVRRRVAACLCARGRKRCPRVAAEDGPARGSRRRGVFDPRDHALHPYPATPAPKKAGCCGPGLGNGRARRGVRLAILRRAAWRQHGSSGCDPSARGHETASRQLAALLDALRRRHSIPSPRGSSGRTRALARGQAGDPAARGAAAAAAIRRHVATRRQRASSRRCWTRSGDATPALARIRAPAGS